MDRLAPWRGNAAAIVLARVLEACGGGGGSSVAPPVIAAQPLAVEIKDGASATFTAATAGEAPLGWQWQKNGVAIAGATAASYTTPPLTLADSQAQYRVLVTNAGGATTSQSATVTVDPVAPAIDVQPASISVADGANATFSVHAGGSPPQSYQWSRNGVAVSGANACSLAVDPASLADSGATFSVQASNIAGTATSQAAALTVTPVAAHIGAGPQAQTAIDGATVTFGVTAVGSAPLGYQWYADGVAVAGATSASYAFAAAYTDNGKQVSVVVSNAYGTDSSAAALLTVDPQAPTLASAPQDVNVQVGGTAGWCWRRNSRSSGTEPARPAQSSSGGGTPSSCNATCTFRRSVVSGP